MNDLLGASAEVRAACAHLTRPVAMVQRLDGGPDGGRVCYAMRFADTVEFSLGDVPDADIVLVGDWRQMVRAARAQRQGRVEDSGMRLEQGEQALSEINEAFAVARSVATVPVQLPDV